MGNKRYSNKGYNAELRAREAAAAQQSDKKTTLIICAIAAGAVVLAVLLAVLLTALPTQGEVDMAEVSAEINSMALEDFTETEKKTDYVKITVKDHGDVIIRLREDIAPETVKNFQNLVAKDFYDGLTFHRVMKGFMIQGGDPEGTGSGSSDKKIKGEFSANGVRNDLSHVKGVISMARAKDMNSASCQFFICNANASATLDGKYAGFGYVVAGLDTVDSVSDIEVTANNGEMSKPAETVTIEKICFVQPK